MRGTNLSTSPLAPSCSRTAALKPIPALAAIRAPSSLACGRTCEMSTLIVNEFRIFAHGDAFDVDSFLATTRLRPDFVWRRGDQRRYACVESKHETSGVEFTLGDGWTLPFREQERTAIEYLKAHREELRLLGKYPGVETFILGLQYVCKLNESILGFCQGVSTPLMRLCV